MVCAAGNDSNEVDYPGCSPYTFAAAAIDSNNNRASFSCYGDEVDFALPGVSLILPDKDNDSDYAGQSGTSFSTPFLSSAIAQVMCERGTNISRDELLEILKYNTEDLGNQGKDSYYGWGSINFNNKMFNRPQLLYTGVDNKTWGYRSNVNFRAICGNKITNYALTSNNIMPSEWMSIANPTNDFEGTIEASENGIHTVWVKDELGIIASQEIAVTHVDQDNPVISSLECIAKSNNSITIQASVKDELSGVSKIDWYYKSASATYFTKHTDICETDGVGKQGLFSKKSVYSNLNNDADYVVYVEVFDMAGNSIVSEIITVRTLKPDKNIYVTNYTNEKAVVTIGNDSSSGNNLLFTTLENTIRVTCDSACVVLQKISENEYVPIEAIETATFVDYDFDISDIQDKNIEIIVALRGDTNLSGSVNLIDAVAIRKSRLSTSHELYAELSALERNVADANKSGSINLIDAVTIRKSRLSEESENYAEIEW